MAASLHSSEKPSQPQLTARRAVQMQVLNLSLSRNATFTLCNAISRLCKSPLYHGYRLSDRSCNGEFWLQAMHLRDRGATAAELRAHFDQGLGRLAGTNDIPSTYLWRELMAAYPEAKVILVERDVETWLKSYKKCIIDEAIYSAGGRMLVWLEWLGCVPHWNAWLTRRATEEYFGAKGRKEVLRNAREVYRRHHAEIRAECAKTGRPLMNYELGSGWKPLCQFLEKEVPVGEPFPFVNMSQETIDVLRAWIRASMHRGMRVLAIRVAFALAVIILLLLLLHLLM